MSHTTHRPRHARPARRTSRYLLAFASAAVVSGAIALPASAATAPTAPSAVAGVLTDIPGTNDDTTEYGGNTGPSHIGGKGGNGGSAGNEDTTEYGGNTGQKDTGDVYAENGDLVGGGLLGGGGGSGGTGGEAGSGRYNAMHPNRDPNGGAYGPDTCLQGYVWRESYDGDTFCVTPAERDAAKASR
ncbi:hypothetical protein ACFCXF_21015 [Streptomyces virginiae]|uniref:hypothetical protein n=1 Tax=Streptomyces virginiae TaxID=1961 RepID=UPI0035D8203D